MSRLVAMTTGDDDPGGMMILKILGPLLLIGGVIMVIMGFISFVSIVTGGVGAEPGDPSGFDGAGQAMGMFAGGALTAVMGMFLTGLGFQRQMFKFGARRAAPAVKILAAAIAEGAEGAKKSCLKCGAANDAEAKFCNDCGESMKSEKKCDKCGSMNDVDAKFCNDCGKRLV